MSKAFGPKGVEPNQTTRAWRLNVRAAVLLAVGAGLILGGAAGWVFWKGRNAAALFRQAEEQARAGPPRYDLALSYLAEYLQLRPHDVAALDRKSEILARTAQTPEQLQEAIALGEQALRLAPDGPHADAIRKRIIELDLALVRYLPAEQQRLGTAEQLATQLAARAADAEALRLLGRVLRAQALLGDTKALEGDPDPKHPRRGAIPTLEQARALDPAHVGGAFELAQIYRFDRTPPDPARAVAVLDELLAAVSRDPEKQRDLGLARLARHRYFAQAAGLERDGAARLALRQQAAAELDAALAAHPDDLPTLLAAAEFAARQGDVAAARRHLERVPAGHRDDLAVRLIEGLVEQTANQPEAAIAAWRQGLQAVGGTSADLTRHLAETLLQLGRLDEAEPLLRQHRRLTGGAEPVPSHRYLLGLKLLKLNRPAEARDELLRALLRTSDPALAVQVQYALGQAYEALRDIDEALEQYDKAIQQAPRWAAPRVARARLLQASRPDEAALELQAALADQPDEPALLLALARAQLAVQARRPAAERRFGDLSKTLEQARRVVPDAPGLALLEADLTALTNPDPRAGVDAAVARLRQAVARSPGQVELWAALAGGLARVGRTEEALAVLDEAAQPQAVGDQASLRIARARLLTALSRGQEARAALVQNAERLPPDQQALVWAERGHLLRQRRELEEARTAYEHWAALAPGDPQPLLVLLELDELLGDTATAARRIAALERLGAGGRLLAQVARAQALLREPEPGRAETAEARAVRLAQAEALVGAIESAAPQQPYGALLRGLLAERRDQPAEAAAAYERALDKGASQEAASRLAVLYGRLGRLEKLADLRRRLPETGSTFDRLATAELLARGQDQEAELLAQKLAAGDPESLDARVWEARVLNTIGKPEQAERTLRDLAERSREPAPWLTLLFFQISRRQPAAALAATIDQIKQRVTAVELPELLWAQCYQASGATAAAAAYDAALAKWPADLRVVRAATGFFQNAGQPARAEALFRATLARDPAQRWAARGLALLLSARPGGWEEAWAFVQAPTGTAETPEDRLARALVLARSSDPKRHEEAEAVLEELVADLPPDAVVAASARDLLILQALRKGQADRARRLAGIAAAGSNPGALALLAETTIRAGRPDEAERQIERLASLAPQDLNVVKLRALLLKQRGQPEAAAALVEAAFAERVDARDGEAVGRELLGLFVNASDAPGIPPALLADQPETAERIARRLAERWPGSAWVLGRLLARGQRPEPALDACMKTVEAPHARVEDLIQAAQLAVGLATAPGAAAALRQQADLVVTAALQRQPETIGLLQLAALLRHAQGRFDEELALYRRIEALEPADLTYLNNLAWILSENFGQPAAALPLIDRLLAHIGENPQCLDTKGMILLRLGRASEALPLFQKAVQALPHKPVYRYHLARAARAAGDEAGFRAHWAAVRQAGLTADQLEATERAEFEELLAEFRGR